MRIIHIPRKVSFGLLYNWYAATDVRNLASTGWHVPTATQASTFITYLGGVTGAASIAEKSLDYWADTNIAIGTIPWKARGTGSRNQSGNFISFKQNSPVSIIDASLGKVMYIFAAIGQNQIYVTTANESAKKFGCSVRLMKDSTTLTNGQTGTYTGNNGKVYPTICVGTQEWLSESLAETQYRNGDWITGYNGGVYTRISTATWAALTTEALCIYNDDLRLL